VFELKKFPEGAVQTVSERDLVKQLLLAVSVVKVLPYLLQEPCLANVVETLVEMEEFVLSRNLT